MSTDDEGTPTEDEGLSADELPGEELEEEAGDEAEEDVERALLTDDGQLFLSDVENIAARRGLRVVLLAGEVAAGKTTLLTSLWDGFLRFGALKSVAFAGSLTALGFERRAWLSRLESRGEEPATERSRPEDDGFLHLRLSAGEALHELLISDVAGEAFSRVREGKPFDEELKWMSRVDLAAILVDGSALGDPARRSTSLEQARRLLGQLGASSELPAGARVAIVLTKTDLVTGEVRDKWEVAREQLRSLAYDVLDDVVVLETAARPDSFEPWGLDELVAWMVESVEERDESSPTPVSSERAAARIREP